MNEFKTYHPIVNFVYFIFVIGFSVFLMHPVCLLVSFMCGFSYSVMLKGKGAIKTNLIYMLPVMLASAIINPAFNHEGATIITYLPSQNPLTLESVAYGLGAALMLVSVICWFSCYNEIMTSDKFIYLFGRIIPSLSLVISMTLRFVPRFSAQLKIVANAQKCMGRDVFCGSIIQRARHGICILSIMTAWALENAIETADSMRSRGYGHPGRTAFSIFTFDKRDKNALLCIAVLGIYTLAGNMAGAMRFSYFPAMESSELSVFGISVLAAYFALCMCPIIIELWEAGKWKTIKSKI
ncbi:MAG: energy-coupling factor transporter transmembrane component T [Clostridiales bacterium]|nr:energy-coupling factor transporter transmembrane component T [Clostridiales bacterium]